MCNARAFQLKDEFYFGEFKNVVELLIYSYNLILENEKFDYDEICNVKKMKPEEYIRNVFLRKEYLWNKKFKNQFGIKHLNFDAESAEINIENITTGYHDIKVTGIGLYEFGETDKHKYFSFECKRLNKGRQDTGEYIKEGIKRYTTSKYSGKMPLAGMIGFVEEEKTCDYIVDINKRLKKHKDINSLKYLEFYEFTHSFNDSYHSIHQRKNSLIKQINIFHFFFDISTCIKLNH